jgi:hypothetical protein
MAPKSPSERVTDPGATPTLPPGAEDILKTAPAEAYRRRYKAAVLGKLSTKQAISVHCQHCMGWTREHCDNESCPLWMVSPWGRRKRGRVAP